MASYHMKTQQVGYRAREYVTKKMARGYVTRCYSVTDSLLCIQICLPYIQIVTNHLPLPQSATGADLPWTELAASGLSRSGCTAAVTFLHVRDVIFTISFFGCYICCFSSKKKRLNELKAPNTMSVLSKPCNAITAGVLRVSEKCHK